MDNRWSKSLENKFQQEKINPKPIKKIRFVNKGMIIKNNTAITCNFKIMNKGSRIAKPIRKFRKLPRMTDKGINSRGKTACFNIEPLAEKEFVTSDRALEKNIQGIIPERTKSVKFGISTLNTLVKIKLILTAKIKGVIIAHQIPSLEPEYFIFNCFTVISQRRRRLDTSFFNLELNILKGFRGSFPVKDCAFHRHIAPGAITAARHNIVF